MPKIARRTRFPVTQLLATLALLVGLSLVYATKPANAAETRSKETRLASLDVATDGGGLEGGTKVAIGRETGLALPRFVSLKFESTNLRVGPGTKYAVSWAYKRKGLPVEVIQEFDRWRRIRDAEGTTGWVLHSLLSSSRTAIVAPWRRGFEAQAGADLAALALLNGKQGASSDAVTVARFQPGLQVGVEGCSKGWCAVQVQSVRAWLEQDKLWGVYEDEKFGG